MPDEVTHKLCVDQPRVYQTTSCIDAVFRMLQSQVLGQDITGRTSLNSLTCYLSTSIVADGEDQHMASKSRSVTDILI